MWRFLLVVQLTAGRRGLQLKVGRRHPPMLLDTHKPPNP
jgi:hypothetical protein